KIDNKFVFIIVRLKMFNSYLLVKVKFYYFFSLRLKSIVISFTTFNAPNIKDGGAIPWSLIFNFLEPMQVTVPSVFTVAFACKAIGFVTPAIVRFPFTLIIF